MTFIDLLVIAYFVAVLGLMLFALARGHYAWKPLLILFVLSLAGLNLWFPTRYGPKDQLHRGLDLAGGTTFIYQVEVPAGSDPDTVIPNLISVLRDRVDPQGVRDLNWRQMAGNRIQIQMPLASKNVREEREAYMTARTTLLKHQFSRHQIDQLLRADSATQARLLDQLAPSGGSAAASQPADQNAAQQGAKASELRNQLVELLGAHQAFADATKPYQQTQNQLNEAKRKLKALPKDAPNPRAPPFRLRFNSFSSRLNLRPRPTSKPRVILRSCGEISWIATSQRLSLIARSISRMYPQLRTNPRRVPRRSSNFSRTIRSGRIRSPRSPKRTKNMPKTRAPWTTRRI